MTSIGELDAALEALDDCDAALLKLDTTCCEPGRSPRMKALADTLAEVRVRFDGLSDDPGGADAVTTDLEDAGAQIGRLQVGCCAPNRLPLYARMLKDLTTAQRTLDKALHRGH